MERSTLCWSKKYGVNYSAPIVFFEGLKSGEKLTDFYFADLEKMVQNMRAELDKARAKKTVTLYTIAPSADCQSVNVAIDEETGHVVTRRRIGESHKDFVNRVYADHTVLRVVTV